MTPTLVIAKDGQARPVNPYEEYQTNAVGDNTWKRTQEWKDFESTVKWHNCPYCEDGKEYFGELITEYYIYGIANNYWTTNGSNYKGKGTRQVWRIVAQPQEKQTMEKKMTGAICKICNSQGLRNCAHPEECGNWEPIYEDVVTKKEEAKTVEGKCQCEICKMTIGEAKQLAFMNYLLAEITIEDYDHINQMLNDYATSKRNYRRANACSYDSKGNSLFARNK